MVQWLKIPLDPAMPARKQDLVQRYEKTKLRTVQDVTYEDENADVEVLNAIMDVVVNGDIPVVNGDEAEQEMVNENEERTDEQLSVDCCDDEASDDEFELIDWE
jgi:hypothetical protein